ncbi:MAG TPA: methyl-accepting chemotaxis protein, partial [Treponemataceae bacterium]|nr:methyl-accepting chemotaxis protein [Treponemataceae bacterium]
MKIAQKLLLIITGALITFLVANVIIVGSQFTQLSEDIITENVASKLRSNINAAHLFLEEAYEGIVLKNGSMIGTNGKNVENNTEFVDFLKSTFSTQATIFKREGGDFTRVATSILQDDGQRAVGTTLNENNIIYQKLTDGETYVGETRILDNPYIAIYSPILGQFGEVIGLLFLGENKETIQSMIRSYQVKGFLIVVSSSILAILIIVAFSYLLIKKTILHPITNTVSLLKNISEGDGDLSQRIEIQSKDEIGDLAKYFNLTVEKIGQTILLVKNQTTQLKLSGELLATNTNQTATAINQITANISSIQNQTVN